MADELSPEEKRASGRNIANAIYSGSPRKFLAAKDSQDKGQWGQRGFDAGHKHLYMATLGFQDPLNVVGQAMYDAEKEADEKYGGQLRASGIFATSKKMFEGLDQMYVRDIFKMLGVKDDPSKFGKYESYADNTLAELKEADEESYKELMAVADSYENPSLISEAIHLDVETERMAGLETLLKPADPAS
jgi:hypothetical protein